MLTPERRWNSGAAMYLRSQAGNSGQRTLRYSRASGVRDLRDLSLQVVMSRDLAAWRPKRPRFPVDSGAEIGAMTGAGAAATCSAGTSSGSSVGSAGSGFGASSGTGMVAFLPVGRW